MSLFSHSQFYMYSCVYVFTLQFCHLSSHQHSQYTEQFHHHTDPFCGFFYSHTHLPPPPLHFNLDLSSSPALGDASLKFAASGSDICSLSGSLCGGVCCLESNRVLEERGLQSQKDPLRFQTLQLFHLCGLGKVTTSLCLSFAINKMG